MITKKNFALFIGLTPCLAMFNADGALARAAVRAPRSMTHIARTTPQALTCIAGQARTGVSWAPVSSVPQFSQKTSLAKVRPPAATAMLTQSAENMEIDTLTDATANLSIEKSPEAMFARMLDNKHNLTPKEIATLHPEDLQRLMVGGLAYLKHNINPLTIKDAALQELVKTLRALDPGQKITTAQAQEIVKLAHKAKPQMIENNILGWFFLGIGIALGLDEAPLASSITCIIVGLCIIVYDDE